MSIDRLHDMADSAFMGLLILRGPSLSGLLQVRLGYLNVFFVE